MSDVMIEPVQKRIRKRSRVRIADRLNAAQVAIDDALADAELQTALAAYGYTAERLQQGKRLYQAVLELQHQQRSEYGGKQTASNTFKAAWEQADTTYMRLFKVARVALKEQRGDWLALGLDGNRSRTFAGWLAQAQQFYTNALAQPDVLAQLGEFGITEAKLRAGLAEVAAAEAAYAAQKRDKGTAQQATQVRNVALRQLARWHSDFVKIARVAFEDHPQRLEQLGIIVPSL